MKMCPKGFEITCRKCGQPLEAHILKCPSKDSISLDYIAGFFDGEGTASIKASKTTKSWCGVAFMPRLGFFQKTPNILEKIAVELGLANKGYKLHHRLTGSKGAYGECYRLEVNGIEDVLRIAKMLEPRCIIKKRQLQIVIEASELLLKTGFPQRRGYVSSIPKETIKKLIELTEEVRKLNSMRPDARQYTNLEAVRKALG
jgi:hypothetical protein